MNKYSLATSIISILLLGILTSFIRFSAGNDAKIDHSTKLFRAFLQTLDRHYMNDIDPEQLTFVGFRAMMDALDPYSKFWTAKKAKKVNKGWKGHARTGIGVRLQKRDNNFVITDISKHSPAQKHDLHYGDQIVAIDNQPLTGQKLKVKQVSKLLHGEINTPITLSLYRPHQGNIEKVFERKDIKKSSMPFYGMANSTIVYIKLDRFIHGITDSLAKKIQLLQENNLVEGLILDIRHNSGGMVREAISMTGLFVNQGDTVYMLHGKNYNFRPKKTPYPPFDTQIPIVLLINKKTASAAEIFAGAMQDHDRAVLIGQQTFGKGMVQSARGLGIDGHRIYPSVGRYHSPSGRCIQRLDYSRRIEGIKKQVYPDSLQAIFYTKNGREVYSHRGVDPDIMIENEPRHSLVKNLQNKQVFFDFAVWYRSQHPNLLPPQQFRVSDTDFAQFVDFAMQHHQQWQLPTEIALQKFWKTALANEDSLLVKQEFDILEGKIINEKRAKLIAFQQTIRQALGRIIVQHYYLKAGTYAFNLQYDKAVVKGIDILQDKQLYSKTLNVD